MQGSSWRKRIWSQAWIIPTVGELQPLLVATSLPLQCSGVPSLTLLSPWRLCCTLHLVHMPYTTDFLETTVRKITGKCKDLMLMAPLPSTFHCIHQPCFSALFHKIIRATFPQGLERTLERFSCPTSIHLVRKNVRWGIVSLMSRVASSRRICLKTSL